MLLLNICIELICRCNSLLPGRCGPSDRGAELRPAERGGGEAAAAPAAPGDLKQRSDVSFRCFPDVQLPAPSLPSHRVACVRLQVSGPGLGSCAAS